MRPKLLAAAAALLLATAAGCARRAEARRALPSPLASGAAMASGTPPRVALLPGERAPEVSFKLQDDFELPLSSLLGKVVVIYFCGDHREPECIGEARTMRDRWPALEAVHVAVVGVTREDGATRREVIARERLPFDLASDSTGKLAASFGVQPTAVGGWRGFLIGRDGVVRAVWSASDPDQHVAALFAAAR